MRIWKISLQNIKSKKGYTLVSIFTLALSSMLLLGIQQLKKTFQYQVNNNIEKIDMVVGAKGSPLQLVLSSVLHMDNPTGNILYNDAKKIGESRLIKTAIPISYGDNYKGYKIVGTTKEFASLYNAVLDKGREVNKAMEVVLGHDIAKNLELELGDTFLSSHGLLENDLDVHSEYLTVVGIYKQTNKVIDRLIITDLESIWEVHHHEKEEHHHDDGEHYHKTEHHSEKEITSLLVTFKSPTGLLTMPKRINKNTNMQAALPKYELDKLYEYTGVGFTIISVIAYVIFLVSSLIIFISIYKMIKEQRFYLALFRTYGASNLQLLQIIAYETFTIVSIAFLLGIAMAKGGLYFMFSILNANYQQTRIQDLAITDYLELGSLVFTVVVLSVLLAIYPIVKMNISTTLSHEK
ncbi:putative ABC transport system permease protein [Wenyingzhuangia heitensis]|uniref:ABC transport system permease protein n=1 Tax=Wenyingzhuangia heitensis TaxID=1487859 RepID=A0ABX0UGN6_9FLAO|nr:ABC transporter permease [Wenyingzhuangia heitensis]NIJ46556.1 putative ABC transport system permease protein [Wenyingzhuangia heitensis]